MNNVQQLESDASADQRWSSFTDLSEADLKKFDLLLSSLAERFFHQSLGNPCFMENLRGDLSAIASSIYVQQRSGRLECDLELIKKLKFDIRKEVSFLIERIEEATANPNTRAALLYHIALNQAKQSP